MFRIIGADDCVTDSRDNVFESEKEAHDSLEFLRKEYPGQLDDAYVEKTGRFYGFDWGTYYVAPSGRKWLIQSDDRDGLPVEVTELPAGGEWIDSATCCDMDLSGCE